MAEATTELRKVVMEPRRRFIAALSKAAHEMAEEAGVQMGANTPELDRLISATIRAEKEMTSALQELLRANGVEAVEGL